MWIEMIQNLLLFIVEAIVIVVAVVFCIVTILVSVGKSKLEINKGKLKVTALHTEFKKDKDSLNEIILDKPTLKSIIKEEKKTSKIKKQNINKDTKKIFVLDFNGDIHASQVESLRKEITSILSVANPLTDEVLVRLQSPGGVVNGYGLAASQLDRLKQKHIKLIISVDQVAASGGYMMACVADKILCSPFAIVGSIGVIAQIPNFNKLLNKHGVDIELHTAGKYKRTLTTLGKNTKEGREKFKNQLDGIQKLFKNHIIKHRPAVEIEEISTGEYWFGTEALELKLVDEIITSDDFLQFSYQKDNSEIYLINYEIKKSKFGKIQSSLESSFTKIFRQKL